jgi:hypothetical protein
MRSTVMCGHQYITGTRAVSIVQQTENYLCEIWGFHGDEDDDDVGFGAV